MGLINRSIEKWFSRPAEDVEYRTNVIASLLTEYAQTNARDEALRIAATPDAQKSFHTGNFTFIMDEFRRSEVTLQGGFAFCPGGRSGRGQLSCSRGVAVDSPSSAAGSRRPRAGDAIRCAGADVCSGPRPRGRPRSDSGGHAAAAKLPEHAAVTSSAARSSIASCGCSGDRLRRTYLGFLLLLTVGVLFASTWLALFLSKMVTRPLVALAEATQEISRGRLDYRVDVKAGSEIGKLVESFNRMAADLEASRSGIEASRRELADMNAQQEQRTPPHRDHSGERSLRRAVAGRFAAHRSFQRRAAPAVAAGSGPAGRGPDAARSFPADAVLPTWSTCCAKPIAWAAPPARWRPSLPRVN